MRHSVRVIVFNSDEEYSATIRSDLLGLDGVQIVAEFDEFALIEQAVKQFSAEILIVHLDPTPELILPIAAQIASSYPKLAVFVIAEKPDAEHVLIALRAGVREFLTKPVDRDLLGEAIKKIATHISAYTEVGRLITVLGTIGGVGASMLAANLATELYDLVGKRPVALVDLDFRYGQQATMLDLQADYTIADLCDTPEQLDPTMINKAMVKHRTGVHLLARPNHLGQADHITAAQCASVLSSLQQMYAYVVVDGPIRFDPCGQAVLDLAAVNLFIIQLLVTSVRNVHRMFNELREGGYNLERFRMVCNRVGRESGHLEVEHVEKTLNKKIEHLVPDDWKTVSSAINVGSPLIEYAPKSRIRAAIRELAESIVQPEGMALPSNGSEAKSSSLLNRIFSVTT